MKRAIILGTLAGVLVLVMRTQGLAMADAGQAHPLKTWVKRQP